MQLGAAYAGLAIENSMLGASHALANPLTAQFGVPHGQAVGLMLPHVVRFNGLEFDDWYRELIDNIDLGVPSDGSEKASELLAAFVTNMLELAGLETQLGDLGIGPSDLGELADAAARQWTGNFNPRNVDEQTLLAIYREAI
jgi:alcohol dehydrogenase